MNKRPKISEMDIIRAFAIIAVVIIHCTANASLLPVGTVTQALFFTINRLSHFTVPVFIWISGVVLFYNYYDHWNKQAALAFTYKRIKRLLMPYLLWSLFYYFYNQFMFHGKIGFDGLSVLKLLLSGNASYHLYYIVIIVQFYLLCPILMSLMTNYRFIRINLIPLAFLFQAAVYSYSHWVQPIPYYSSLFPGYSVMFAFGAWSGIYYQSLIKWLDAHRSWIIAFFGIAGICYTAMYVLDQYGMASFENTWYELVLLLFCAAAGPSFLQIGKVMLAQSPQVSTILLSLGAASFGIYLAHPAILTLWDAVVPPPGNIMLYDLHIIAATLLSLFGSWGLVFLYRSLESRRQFSLSEQKGKESAS
jgi:peptidoglycan/LPS O-acetylase OafA/YrhL